MGQVHGAKMVKIKMNDAVSAQENDWPKMCTNAAKSISIYNVFRSTKTFQRVVEGSPISSGLWNLKRLLNNRIFTKSINLIQQSDTIGLPLNKIDFELNSRTYSLSPTTIRYTNNALNCLSLFGKKIFDGNTNIYEVGAGYGGECKIFNDIAITTNQHNLKDKWFIYDLQTSTSLITKFLNSFNYTTKFLKLTKQRLVTNNKYLVISNGAFSEMHGELLNQYFDKVISGAKYGYFITNFETHSAPHGGWTTSDFIEKLRASGKTDVTILPTTKYLSYFDHQANSKLIVFGHNKLQKSDDRIIDIGKIYLLTLIIKIYEIVKGNFAKQA